MAGPCAGSAAGRAASPAIGTLRYMRKWTAAACLTGVILGSVACSGTSDPTGIVVAPTPAATPSPTPSPTPTPPPPIDLVPEAFNEPGYPICGFLRGGRDPGIGAFAVLYFGVAVGPAVPADYAEADFPRVRVNYRIEERLPDVQPNFSFTATFSGPDEFGHSIKVGDMPEYPADEAGFLGVYDSDGVLHVIEPWSSWLGTTITVTVTVDAHNEVEEVNEDNNTMTLRARATSSGDISITDNECDIVAE